MTNTEKDQLLFDQVMGAASFDFENIHNLKDIFARRKIIAQNYNRELKEEFNHLNNLLREHLSL